MDFFTQDNIVIVLAALGGIGEVLSLIPAVKSNGVFQLIFNGVTKLGSLFGKKK